MVSDLLGTIYVLLLLKPVLVLDHTVLSLQLQLHKMVCKWIFNMNTSLYIYITLIFDFSLSAPSAPPNMALISSITSNGFTISWNPPGYNDQNGVITYYSISVVEIETGSIFQYISYTTTVTIQSLHPAYTYQYRIAAYTIRLGPYSDPINITTAEEGIHLNVQYALVMLLYSSNSSKSSSSKFIWCCIFINVYYFIMESTTS